MIAARPHGAQARGGPEPGIISCLTTSVQQRQPALAEEKLRAKLHEALHHETGRFWGLGCRSAGRLSERITDDWRALTCHVALSLASLRRLIRPPHHEWSAATVCHAARSMHKT